MSFIQLTDEETILKIYHRHWYAYLGDVISIITLLVAPLFLVIAVFFIPDNIKEFLSQFIGGSLGLNLTALTAMWVMIAWLFGWSRWTDLYLDAIVITNERIYQVRQNGFFSRTTTSFPIERIQNISVKTEGLIATLLGFGELELETAGEGEDAELDMSMMPNPDDIKLYINTVHDYKKNPSSEI